jgi:hypothetical protein
LSHVSSKRLGAGSRPIGLAHVTREGAPIVRQLVAEATWQALRGSPKVRAYLKRAQRSDPQRRKIALLATAIGFWRARSKMSEEEFAQRRGNLEGRLDRLLARPRIQPTDVAIQHRTGKRRESIRVCLYVPAAEPTNNRAARDLRPVVIARKVSCGNKTEPGKRSFEALRSAASSRFEPRP